jgi:hypothetical protein
VPAQHGLGRSDAPARYATKQQFAQALFGDLNARELETFVKVLDRVAQSKPGDAASA